ncbi:hypothetical protein TPB0596_00840 [Tsukamurella pulmonis]|uniref:hypothetical protein n=1 Tax=Tsukamurella pulmonis TaxID=47312 RepID=UPI001EDCA0E6|nr:hypothetical protein [Tsukamurella pulmonis]BDD80321.1 hypothetical protein TPB0596_00840 [Tsukamurella pulmonis]
MTVSLLSDVLEAQTRNARLRGDDLRRVGEVIAAHAVKGGVLVSAVDRVSERLVAAASIADGTVLVVDESERLDGQRVLLVAGHCAGPMSIATQASITRALGAMWVEAMYMAVDSGGWSIPGVDALAALNVHDLGRRAAKDSPDRDASVSFSSEGVACAAG